MDHSNSVISTTVTNNYYPTSYSIQTFNNTTSKINYPSDSLTIDDKLLIVKIRLIVYAYIVSPIAVIGIALNSFTVLVLLHPKLKNQSTNAYLTALSIANIVCLINFLFLYSFRYGLSNEIFKKNVYQNSEYNEIHPYESFINLIYGIWSPIFTTFQLYAIYMTCAVTVDRWICVTWPLKVEKICSIRNTIKTIILLFLFCVLYNLPRWFEIESFLVTSKSTNRTYYQAKITSIGANSLYHEIVRKYAYLIFVYGIPFLVLLIVNIGIIRKLIETKRRKHKLLGSKATSKKSTVNTNDKITLTSNQTSNQGVRLDPKVTLMILAVVLAFFCSQFPYLIIHLLSKSNAEKLWFHIAKCLCDLLAVLNYCINFIIYCFFGQNFREIAKTIVLNPSLSPYKQKLHVRSNSFHNNNVNMKVNKLNVKINKNNEENELNLIKPLIK
jgi:hypothetical protein